MKSAINLIIRREYLTRVKKKSFVIMTFLTPLLIVAAYALIIYLNVAAVTKTEKKVMIWDETGIFSSTFKSNDLYTFNYIFPKNLDDAKRDFLQSGDDLLLYVPKTQVIVPETAHIFSQESVGLGINSYIKSAMKKEVERIKLESSGVSQEVIESINTEIVLNTYKVTDTGEEERSYPEIRIAISIIFSILIYFFVFLFGAQVMRGVIEEKTNRVIEVMAATAKPYQLMTGKIIGIALVGLTQFVLWLVFSAILIAGATPFLQKLLPETVNVQQITQMAASTNTGDIQQLTTALGGNEDLIYIIESLQSINYGNLIFSFLFFFIFGYIFYASIFAALGAVVDNETDSQQFTIPITIPLIICLSSLQGVIEDPNGSIAFWLSMIPFTSPVIMMTRIPFGIPWWEVILSCSVLILSVVAAILMSAKIYRIGILTYGKKLTYADLWKWLRS